MLYLKDKIKTVIFDLDDTLYNEAEFVRCGFYEVAKYLSNKYAQNEKELFNEIELILESDGRGRIFDTICSRHGFSEDIKKLVSIYRDTFPKIELYDDSKELIEYLKGKYNLGIITDGMAKVQWNKIKALGLHNIFEKIIVTDDYGREFWKPNKFCYDKMLKYFDTKSYEAVYIGDNPIKDFIAPKELGMYTVRVVRKFGDYMKISADKCKDADFSVQKLNELIKYL